MGRPRNIDREEREARGKPVEGPLWVTWDEGDVKGRAHAMEQAGNAHSDNSGVVIRSNAAQYDVGGGISVREGMNRGDYANFRPGEGKPRKPRDILAACMRAYDEFGIVRNIIDTMGDFCTQGIALNHPNPRIEKFYQEWFYKVCGPDISEHIANTLFLTANAPVRRHTAKLKKKDVNNLQKGIGAETPDPPFLLEKKEIPWRYTIMNPVQMVVLGGDLVPFLGPDAFTYAVEVPVSVLGMVQRPRTQIERELVSRLPPEVKKTIMDGVKVIPLSSNAMKVLHYKRRHWQVWATPLLYPLLDDLKMLAKLKLADLSALDGAISHIRIWKLGSLELRMLPTKKAIAKLAEMLSHAGNGGSMDLIWGPDLELQETATDIYKFLGDAKYAPVLAAIFSGFGIPPTLVGAAIQGGMTNNFISLKTLTERLQYVRRLVREFWEYEASLVQQAMGFRLPASVHFDRMVLTDEAAEKALLIQLADRDLISVKTIQERFGEDPMLELVRQRQEQRMREKKKLPQKASPWHNPEFDDDAKKIFAQLGVVTPSQLGVELDANDGEKTLIDQQAKQENQQQKVDLQGQQQQMDHQHRMEKMQLKHGVHPGQLAIEGVGPGAPSPAGGTGKPGPKPTPGGGKPKGQPGQGRPKNAKDSKKRKKKEVRVRTKAALIASLAWAEDAQKSIAEVTAPAYLKSCGKKNLRQLTTQEAESFEKFKFSVLANLPLGVKVGPKSLASVLACPLPVPVSVTQLLKATVGSYRDREGKEPSVEKVREFMSRIIALHKGE